MGLSASRAAWCRPWSISRWCYSDWHCRLTNQRSSTTSLSCCVLPGHLASQPESLQKHRCAAGAPKYSDTASRIWFSLFSEQPSAFGISKVLCSGTPRMQSNAMNPTITDLHVLQHAVTWVADEVAQNLGPFKFPRKAKRNTPVATCRGTLYVATGASCGSCSSTSSGTRSSLPRTRSFPCRVNLDSEGNPT